MADGTAPFMLDDTAALRAGTALMSGCFIVAVIAIIDKMVLDRFCNCVGAGKHPVIAKARRAMAGDALKLFYHLSCLNAASPG